MLYNDERPQRFDEMVGQKHIVANIQNQSLHDSWFQVYILAGQFGSGKTTMARIIELAINCSNKDSHGNPCLECDNCKDIIEGRSTDIMEIDAASNTGVDSIRDLKEAVSYLPVNLKKKVYVIDEVHMLSKSAFNALLKVLEEPPKHVVFVLCTTELNAIPATVRSRSAIYIFGQISYEDILGKLDKVSAQRSINISTEALGLIAKNSQGAMRDAYSLLQQVSSGSGNQRIEAEDVRKIIGISDPHYLFDLLKSIVTSKTADCILKIENAVSQGKDLSLMLNELIEIVVDAVVAKSASMDIIRNTEQYKELLSEIVEISYAEQLCHIADGLMDIRIDLRKCPSKTTVIVGLIRITTTTINASILQRLETVENMLNNAVLPKKELSDKDTIQENKEENMSLVHASTTSDVAAVDKEQHIHHGNPSNFSEGMIKEDNTIKNVEEEKEIKEPVLEENIPNDQAENEKSPKDVFDIFSLLETFNNFSSTGTTQNGHTSDNRDMKDNTKLRMLEARLNLISQDDIIFKTSLYGCVKTMHNGELVLKTPLEPVYKIVNTYLTVSGVNDISVEYDSTVSLN